MISAVELSSDIGLVAVGLLTTNILLGLLVSIGYNPTRRWPRRSFKLFTFHNWTGYVALATAALHPTVLVFSATAGFRLFDVLAPISSPVQPFENTVGAIGLYLVAFAVLTSYFRHVFGFHRWKQLHYTTYAAAVAFFVHSLLTDPELKNRPVDWIDAEKVFVEVCMLLVASGTIWRVIHGRRRRHAPMAYSLRSRRPRGDARLPRIVDDPDVLSSYLEDAAHFPGGRASGIATISSEAEAAALFNNSSSVLPIGAQSSLTGGATPMGDTLLSTARLNHILEIGGDFVRVEAGVTLAELDAALERANRYYPPAPTFFGAFVGGTMATNAAGAATFKYGTTRDWVRALTIVLPGGDVLDVERGVTRAHPDGYFEIELAAGVIRIPTPRYLMPKVAKLSAGYFAQPEMDLIDLFIGSEGTLGVITEATLRVVSERPAFCLALVPFSARSAALAFVRRLRDAAHTTWRTKDPRGIDVSAIEHMDARCLELLREDGIDRLQGVRFPAGTAIALLVTLELPPRTRAAQAFDEIGAARAPNAPDTPLVRFCKALDEAGVLDAVEIAVPGDRARADQLLAVREAVPAAVNRRVGLAKQTIDPRIEKTAADMIVPFEALDELLMRYDEGFRRRGLDAAVWGHVSDGNVHPNIIPRSYDDVESGKAAILEFGRDVIRLGGSPLAEHGVGRNAVKQQLLIELYGQDGVEDMRRVKRAIDPGWKLAPGVMFTRSTPPPR